MKTIKFLILGSLVIFFMISCKENEEDKPDKFAMPPLTSRGANTFGCFINGNPFVGDLQYDPFGREVEYLQTFHILLIMFCIFLLKIMI